MCLIVEGSGGIFLGGGGRRRREWVMRPASLLITTCKDKGHKRIVSNEVVKSPNCKTLRTCLHYVTIPRFFFKKIVLTL